MSRTANTFSSPAARFRGNFKVLVNCNGEGWIADPERFTDYATACRYAAQRESRLIRAIVRRVAA